MLSDQGTEGGLPEGAAFIVLGDLNNDPEKGDGRHEAIKALLDHPRIQNTAPRGLAGGATADFDEVGQLRVDYVLPSTELEVVDSGVFWPPKDHPMYGAVISASDHRLVWIDIAAKSLTN